MGQKLKSNILQQLRKDEALVFAIAKGFHRKFRTIETWVRDNDDMLSSPAVVAIIEKETGLSESEILEDVEVRA